MRRSYKAGLDVLGVDAGSFVPWLGIVGKALGGVGGAMGGGGGGAAQPSPQQQQFAQAQQQQQIQMALMQERARQKQEADAKKNKMIFYGALGLVGLGGVYLYMRKK